MADQETERLLRGNAAQMAQQQARRIEKLIAEQRQKAAADQRSPSKIKRYDPETGDYVASTPRGDKRVKPITNGAIGVGDTVRRNGSRVDAMPRPGRKNQEIKPSEPERPIPADAEYKIKYCYSTRDSAGITKVWVGGWKPEPIEVFTMPAGWRLHHASVDNLGKERFSVNLGYTQKFEPPGDKNPLYVHYKVFDGKEAVKDRILSQEPGNATCYGHGWWLVELGEPEYSVNEFSEKILNRNVKIISPETKGQPFAEFVQAGTIKGDSDGFIAQNITYTLNAVVAPNKLLRKGVMTYKCQTKSSDGITHAFLPDLTSPNLTILNGICDHEIKCKDKIYWLYKSDEKGRYCTGKVVDPQWEWSPQDRIVPSENYNPEKMFSNDGSNSFLYIYWYSEPGAFKAVRDRLDGVTGFRDLSLGYYYFSFYQFYGDFDLRELFHKSSEPIIVIEQKGEYFPSSTFPSGEYHAKVNHRPLSWNQIPVSIFSHEDDPSTFYRVISMPGGDEIFLHYSWKPQGDWKPGSKLVNRSYADYLSKESGTKPERKLYYVRDGVLDDYEVIYDAAQRPKAAKMANFDIEVHAPLTDVFSDGKISTFAKIGENESELDKDGKIIMEHPLDDHGFPDTKKETKPKCLGIWTFAYNVGKKKDGKQAVIPITINHISMTQVEGDVIPDSAIQTVETAVFGIPVNQLDSGDFELMHPDTPSMIAGDSKRIWNASFHPDGMKGDTPPKPTPTP